MFEIFETSEESEPEDSFRLSLNRNAYRMKGTSKVTFCGLLTPSSGFQQSIRGLLSLLFLFIKFSKFHNRVIQSCSDYCDRHGDKITTWSTAVNFPTAWLPAVCFAPIFWPSYFWKMTFSKLFLVSFSFSFLHPSRVFSPSCQDILLFSPKCLFCY